MRKLRNPMEVPPGGWLYVVPETNFPIRAGDFTRLVIFVKRHLEVNGIEFKSDGATIEEVIEDQICSRISSALSMEIDGKRSVTFSRVSRPKASRFKNSLGSSVLDRTINLIFENRKRYGKLTVVEQSVAEERAVRTLSDEYVYRSKVCYSCKHQGPVDQAVGRKLRTSLDQKLHVCGVMNVYLRILVHMPADFILSYLPKGAAESLNDTFWLKPELTKGE